MKKGITAVTVAILVIIIVILTGTVTVTSYNSMQNAKKITFALELSNIQEELDSYMRDSFDAEYPITGSQYTFNVSTSSSKVADQFYDETKNSNNEVTLYEIDLSVIGIDDTEYGNKKSAKDVYVVSKETGKVFYLEGIKFKDVTYYTLTQDLIDIKERNEKEEISENYNAPVITTAGFNVRTIDGNEDNIYLSDIKIAGNNVTKVKFDRTQVAEADAYEYFKNNGETLSSDRIKVNEGEYITIYAENSSGDWSIKQEGIPTIPEGFYYVGGSIPTGVVISDSKLDANKGTAVNGKVTSDGLAGNQFVWIPVDDIDDFVTEDDYSYGRLDTMVKDGNAVEPYKTSTYTEEEIEYNAMKANVEENGGFYIGRYEAGTTTERIEEEANGTTELVVQKDKFVYNNIAWGQSMTETKGEVIVEDFYGKKNQGLGAVEISRNMYKSSTSVVSTLCYGVQWDAALRFIATNPEHANFHKDSTGKGNHTGRLEETGYYSTNNIYDMSGNVWEMTMEVAFNIDRIIRGGNYNSVGDDWTASIRYRISPVHIGDHIGFRITLYIK